MKNCSNNQFLHLVQCFQFQFGRDERTNQNIAVNFMEDNNINKKQNEYMHSGLMSGKLVQKKQAYKKKKQKTKTHESTSREISF